MCVPANMRHGDDDASDRTMRRISGMLGRVIASEEYVSISRSSPLSKKRKKREKQTNKQNSP
jgi:hypothetical protein